MEFGSLFEFIRNGMSVKQDKSGDGLPISRIETIADATVNPDKVGFAGLKFEDCKGWLLQPGDILFSHINSVEHVGKCAIYRGLPDQLVHGMNLLCLRCDSKVAIPEFAKYLIRGPAFRSKLSNFINKAVNQASVSIGNLKTISVHVPSISEQRRIAAILDQADALRAKRRETLAQLDGLEDSIFLEFQSQTRDTSCEMLLKDLACKTRGAFVNGPFGSDLLTSELQEEGVPVVYIRDIRNGDYQRVSKSFVTEKKALDLAVCKVQPGDVLVAKVGDPPGIAAVYPTGEPSAVVTQDVVRIRVDREVALPQFVKAYLNSSLGRWKIAGITVEATRARFSLGDFKNLIVELPPIPMQEEFVSRIDAVKKLRSEHQSSLSGLDALFASLQHKAFAGEL